MVLIRQKAIARTGKHVDRENSTIKWLTHLSYNRLNGIILHRYELFKKVLLVALGIWLSIYSWIATTVLYTIKDNQNNIFKQQTLDSLFVMTK